MKGFSGASFGAKGSHPPFENRQSCECGTISVIIPTLNEENHVLSAIRSAKQPGREDEIIVVDGGSTDNTVKIAQPHAVVLASPRGRAVQMNTGAQHAAGNVLLFLHADSGLPSHALTNLEQVMADPEIVGGTFTLKFDHPHRLLRLIAWFSRFRSRYFHYGDQGIFVRRTIFEQLGGFKEISIMEDLDFLRRLRTRGQVALINLPITTSARRFLANGILRHQILNIALVILYLFGTKPQALLRWYEGPADPRLA